MKLFSLETWKDYIKTKDIWEVPFKPEDLDEDNDTSEEEDEVEENLPKVITNQRSLSSSCDQLSEDLLNPNKGFKYFIEQE